MENCAIEDRVVRYWTIRSHDFGAVRKNELGSIMGRRWQEELEAQNSWIEDDIDFDEFDEYYDEEK